MKTHNKSSDAAVYNLASVILLSAKDRKLVVEIKKQERIGKLDSGVDADKLIDDICSAFGDKSNTNYDIPVPHINDTPIPAGIFPDVMKEIGELYLRDNSEMGLRKL